MITYPSTHGVYEHDVKDITQAVHDACGQVYIDQKATPEIRAQAQGFFVLISYGVEQGLGTLAAGWIFNSIMGDGNTTLQQWQSFWAIPLVFALIVTILFIFGFSEKQAEKKEAMIME